MRHFIEPKGIGHFGDIPGAVLQEYLGLLKNPFGNALGGGFLSHLLDRLVEVVNVDI